MKKFLIAAAGLSAFVAAAPAAAQYYDAPRYGYNGYNQQGLVRAYVIRADRLISQVERADSRNWISEREARRLRAAARELHGRTRGYVRNGLNNRERYDLDQRHARIEQALRYAANTRGNGQYRDRDRDGRWDRRDQWIDRDRDGRDDRREDDRGRYPG
ncbi:hypothetical protein [Sphingomonas sp. LHG3406-1]|uniref:hypothetical protein n=1 Tax=Sphingomonas sp. LHG3406-1 TaxID=2804617 RepID=UPI00262383D5|nr:hypothetical protein [Sphingomonas sp. LHG3406-1]